MEYSLLLHEGMVMGAIFLLSGILSYIAIPIIISAAEKRHLFDQPDDDRKLHSHAIPTLGGIAIFFAFLLSFSISPWADSMEGYSYGVAALMILFFVGLKDDLIILSATKKLMAQLVAAALVIFGSGLMIDNFHGVLGIAEIPYWFAVPLTFFSIIVVINAVNLIDGIDGLAGGIGALASIIFGFGFLLVGQWPMAMISLCLAGALLGFLYHNFSPASIFMGDTGSMILGFLLAIQAIEFIGLSGNPVFASYFGNASAILPIAILSFPLYDTLRVVFKRVIRKDSIFEADQDHVHHELLRMGLSHKNASLLLYGKSLGVAGTIGVLSLLTINVNLLLGLFILGCMLIYPTNGVKRRILAKLFGYDWQAYRYRKWGVEFDVNKMSSLNGNGDETPLYIDEEEKEEEYENIAV